MAVPSDDVTTWLLLVDYFYRVKGEVRIPLGLNLLQNKKYFTEIGGDYRSRVTGQ